MKAGSDSPPPVVVGVDGSEAAVHAALWAADEAIRRDTALRLVYVIEAERLPRTVHSDNQVDEECARQSVDRLIQAIQEAGKPVTTDVAIRRGHPADTLIAESRTAALVCVGSTGIGPVASKVLGSTAHAVAERALSPVAVIRHNDQPDPQRAGGIIVVGFLRAQRDDDVFRAALEEAQFRHSPLIAVGVWQDDFGETPYAELEMRVAQWARRYPEAHVYPVPSLGGLSQFLADNADGHIQLAVIGAEDIDQLTNIVGPQGLSLLGHGRCSVLVAR